MKFVVTSRLKPRNSVIQVALYPKIQNVALKIANYNQKLCAGKKISPVLLLNCPLKVNLGIGMVPFLVSF